MEFINGHIWMFIDTSNDNICLLRITNLNKNRLQFKGFIDLWIITSFIRLVIPYINQGITSIGFPWTEFITIVWNLYNIVGGSLFLVIFLIQKQLGYQNQSLLTEKDVQNHLCFLSELMFRLKTERELLSVHSFKVCS